MRIVQLTPGAGEDYYCENCLRDNALAVALRGGGHDVLMVPLYLPAASENHRRVANAPLFFGGVNVYLQQKLGLFRRTPRWVDRLFDAPGLLRWASKMSGMTKARDLGETALSMLRGEHGRQVKELERLVAWLSGQPAADVVVLSNALLLGLAAEIKQALGAAIVCLLQDEEPFVDALVEPYRSRAWQMLAELARGVDGFVAVSRYYGRRMRERLDLRPDRLHVVHNGIDAEGYAPPAAPPRTPTVGFLSQMCYGKGADLLVEAFVRLKSQEGLSGLRLCLSGGKTLADDRLLRRMRRRLQRAGAAGDVEFLDEFDRPAKQAFLPRLTVLSVPSREPEAFGLFVLEALACGVPVVLPRHGAFVELVEATEGGVLYEPNKPSALAAALRGLVSRPEAAREMGLRGREAVLRDFVVARTAERLADVYEGVIEAAKRS